MGATLTKGHSPPHLGRRSISTKHGGQGLGGLEELGGGDGVAIGGVNWDGGEGRLEGVEVGASLGDLSGSHGVWGVGWARRRAWVMCEGRLIGSRSWVPGEMGQEAVRLLEPSLLKPQPLTTRLPRTSQGTPPPAAAAGTLPASCEAQGERREESRGAH